MESGLRGFPISAAQVAPMAAAPGIRAPLTADESDFEYSVSSKSRRNSIASSYYSNSELEYEGSEDEEILEENHFLHEYGFYKPSVIKHNEEMVRESSFRNGYGFPRPAVRSTDGKIARGNGNVNRNAIFGPFVGNPDEEFGGKSGGVDGSLFSRAFVGNPGERTCKVVSNVNDSDDSRSFLNESGDEYVENEDCGLDRDGSRPLAGVTNEENLGNGPTPVLDINAPFVQKLQIPIAKISGDSDDDDDDDDSQGSHFLEDEGFLGIVRVPSFEVLRRLNSAPKVRMSEADEGDDNESQAEDVVEMEVVEDSVVSKGDLGDKDENERVDVTDIEKCVISSDIVQDIGVDVSNEDKVNSFAVKEQYNPVLKSGLNGDVMHLEEEIKEIDVTDDQKECVDLVGCGEDDLVLDQDSVNEKLETDGEMEIEQSIIESFSSISAHKINSLQESIDIEDMADSHLDNASLSGDEACQSVFEVAKSDQETAEEVENSEELPGEVEYSTFHADTNEVVPESERVQDSMTKVQGSSEESVIDNFKAVKGVVSDDCGVNPESVDGMDNFSVGCDSGDLVSVFGSASPIIESRASDEGFSETEKLGVKYLRIVHQPGQCLEDSVASKDIHQPSVAEATTSSPQTNFLDSYRTTALELEARVKSDLDFSLCILVIGKTGVGKSATINSIFGESKATVNALEPSTTHVKEIIGEIDGVKVKVFDTPGFRISPIEQWFNRKILLSIKKLMRKSPPDVVLYVDRLDTQSSNFNDLPLLKSVTSYLGSSIWQKTIIVFTHSNLLPSDGPDGCPLSYEEFTAQQSRAVQQLINQSRAAHPMVKIDDSMIPVSLVENHLFAEKNENGDALNGENWRSKLLSLCCSMKILSESSSLAETRNPTDHLNLFFLRCPFLEPSCQLLTRSVFDSALIEDFDITGRFPAVIAVHLTKDKKEFDIQLCPSRGVKGSNVMEIPCIRHKGGDLGVNVSVGLNEKLGGRIYVKTRCSDQLQIAASAFFPIARAVFDKIFGQSVTED